MKKLSRVIAITAVAAMSFSCLSAYAAKMPESTKMGENHISQKVNWDGERIKISREEFAAAIESGEFDGIAGKRDGRTSFGGNRIELSDEQKTERTEKIVATITEKLQTGEITQEEYDEAIAKIADGEFMRGGKDGRGTKGEKPEKVEMTEEEKAAKIEELETDLAAKLEAGEITQEEYDEAIAKIAAGEFMRGGKDGRGIKDSKRTKKANGEINSAETISEA